jgi:hypothetical protein
VVTQNPQLIWDARTNRFYYAMSASAGASENRVAFGFSKTANPNNLTSDWCHYTYIYASRFLDHLSLGDNRDFIIFTGNAFQPFFVGTDINAVSKPPPGPIITCPEPLGFKKGFSWNLRDTGGVLLQSAVAANQIDDLPTGYVAARHGDLISGPSNKLWFFNVTRDAATGNPLFSGARQLTLPNTYSLPPVAEQPTKAGQPFTRLRTLDARLTNATMAHNLRYDDDIFYTQHTVRHPTENRSVVRWFEISPADLFVRRTGTVGEKPSQAGKYFFNGAIAPDRQVNGATKRFGYNFVVTYNFSSPLDNPGIGVASSVAGGPLTFRTVKNGIGPYIDLSCPNNGDVCNWLGASAAPDPRPDPTRPRAGRGVVWSTIQYSGDRTPRATHTDWYTLIFATQP